MHATASPGTFPLSPDTMLPDLFSAHPHARAVFDRYGLSGCGGRLGPVESVRFFAQTHGVDERQLLSEIQQSLATPAKPVAVATTPDLADTLYRRFFLGGIATILTAGAAWGAYLLFTIGSRGKFTAAPLHDVNAHGHAQIYGWVGLFIMGFAYQAFPRIWHTTLVAPRLAVAAFVLMIAGLIVRTTGMTLAGSTFSHAPCLAMIGGVAELAAIATFATQILLTFRRSVSARLEPYAAFVLAALGWFLASTAYDLWHTHRTMTALTLEALVAQVATFQAPLRDMQVHGLALCMILGVSLRMLPPLFGLPAVPARRAWTAFFLVTAAVVGEISLFLAYRFTGSHALAAALLLPWIALATGTALVAFPWRLWRPTPTPERSAKFVRAAYAWLAVSLTMLLLLPVYQYATGIPFSHAYYGAIRHAITVGFVSMMIVGIAAKVVPTLNGFDTRTLPALHLPFVLINLGCFLRVSLQTLTDLTPAAFGFVGISGALEVTGLAIWSAHLVSLILQGRRAERAAIEGSPAITNPAASDRDADTDRPDHIAGSMIVADVLHWFPGTAPVFDHYGFTLLRNPLLRRTVARATTLSHAASLRNVPLRPLLIDLSTAAEVPPKFDCEQPTCNHTCHPH